MKILLGDRDKNRGWYTKLWSVNKAFGKIAELADKASADDADDKNKKYVLIIDEINRAPVASVLGELIYALEYRREPVSTPYAFKKDNGKEDNELIIPENLYIIATMNTADRSIGSIDYAVRRRFAFVESPANKDVVVNSWSGNNIDNIVEAVMDLYDKVQGLFVEANLEDTTIHVDDIKIGHIYFLHNSDLCKNENEAKEYMRYRIEYQIMPIIEEYVKDGLLKESVLKVKDKKLKDELLSMFKTEGNQDNSTN